ncbi:MAG: multiheme c-type cytochrome [Planctomycetota bacterium]|jgi:hypothetical protein|nr:multiheme c-type cytochrome [Planctomycetota bacterium]MDP6941272.1 multiheme c-type cytochrome [Planctomycetota bacterium]
MSLTAKKFIIAVLGAAFLASLLFVQKMEIARKQEEAGMSSAHIATPASSERCVECHLNETPGIVDHWTGSTHAEKGVSCFECHEAEEGDVDAFHHEGSLIATIVTPLDCARCHPDEAEEFQASHHSTAGHILASLDNRLAEVAEGMRGEFSPHSPTPGRSDRDMVYGYGLVNLGCKQCHGSKVALEGTDGSLITMDELKPDANGKPTNAAAVAMIARDGEGMPLLAKDGWPNTGIGRFNLDGSKGSCSACHSRHDFSPRRARQPENCGKCHLGPDHPQKEVYEESKHGIAYRDMKDELNLDSETWVLGEDYNAAPTCATCHMSGNKNNGGKITHDPGLRISWTNRPPVSAVMDTDKNNKRIKTTDPIERRNLLADGGDSWQNKRNRMKDVCRNCHSKGYVGGFYEQYDDLITLYNEKFAKPGLKIMGALKSNNVRTVPMFDEEIEWTWFYLWHHEGRRARHGAAMMAPDYTHWHGLYEVAERFYLELIPQAREMAEEAEHHGNKEGADAVRAVIDAILERPEHQWFTDDKSVEVFEFDK